MQPNTNLQVRIKIKFVEAKLEQLCESSTYIIVGERARDIEVTSACLVDNQRVSRIAALTFSTPAEFT